LSGPVGAIGTFDRASTVALSVMKAEERYGDLLDAFNDVDGVTLPAGGSGFGRSALRYRGRIFAMLVRGRLVLKLLEERVDELTGAGHGVRFDASKGTPMKEWLSLDPESALDWQPLAEQALAFAKL
jgi:hypothetical protein